MKSTSRPFLLTLFAAAALLLGLAACGGGSAGVAGPAGSGSFAGSTVTINPTLQFGSGNAITYTNTESGTIFPAAVVPVTGTYTYTPSADATSGTLVLTLPSPINTISLTLQNFQVQGGNVTSFQAVYSGRTFQSSVATGTIPAKSGSSSGTGSLGANERAASTIPSSMQGSYKFSFYANPEGVALSPFKQNDTATFVVGANSLTITSTAVNKTLTNPVFRSHPEFSFDGADDWLFKDGSVEYEVPMFGDGHLGEINVSTAGGGQYLGQFSDYK
jgi:hypothetical protein